MFIYNNYPFTSRAHTKWHSHIEQASRGGFYSMFKTEFWLENYLLRLRTDKSVHIYKIRCSN